jgi:glycosyltransferase involved in cell wall biosynthesis
MLRDILLSGSIPRDPHILRAELRAAHRIRSRLFILSFIPANSVGAELGVFTGLFSSILARQRKIARVTFVDPWWQEFGEQYPDWGAYTDYGRVSTRKAFEVAEKRILRSGFPNRVIEVGTSFEWLANQPDRSLDWVYLDSTHSYEGTRRELELLNLKITDTGLILGDDWQSDRNHQHHGLCLAVNEFLRTTNFELILCGVRNQWVLRRSVVSSSRERVHQPKRPTEYSDRLYGSPPCQLRNMDLSLIICTRDRCQQLARCLQSVRELGFERSWELIIVDNGSSDGTAAIVEQFAATACVPVRYVYQPEPGLGNAHNAGVAIARGEILAFTDDDCYAASDFLHCVWYAFADPTVGYIGGRVMLHDAADHAITINESTTPLIFPPRSFINTGAVMGANMAFRREVLLAIGGFDPLFGPGAPFNAEDADAAARASALGWKGEYRPEVIVRHHHGRKASDAARMWKSYGIGIGAYHMKLLLQGHEVLWFLRSLYQARRRVKMSLVGVLWEPVGAAKYAYLYLTRSLRGWLSRMLVRRPPANLEIG